MEQIPWDNVKRGSGALAPQANMTFLGAMLCKEGLGPVRHKIGEAWKNFWA